MDIDWNIDRNILIRRFDTDLEKTMFNLVNGRAILKLNNTVLVQKSYTPLHINLVLNFCLSLCNLILNNWPCSPTNNFTLNNCLFGTVKLTRYANKKKINHNGGGIVFDGNDMWSFGNGFARNFVILMLIIPNHLILIIFSIR